MPMARVSATGAVVEANAAWLAMAVYASDAGAQGVERDTGVGGDGAARLRGLLDEASNPDSEAVLSTELDVPNLGLNRFARAVVTRRDDAVLLVILPLRSAPPTGDSPVARRLIEDAYQHLSEGVIILDADFRVRLSTGFVTNLVGRPGFANEGLLAFDEIHPDDRDDSLARLSQVKQRPGDQGIAELRIATADGGYRWFEAIATNLLDHPLVQGILVMLRDIEVRKAAQSQLAYRATHDHLTDLPNRALLSERLDAALAGQATATTTLAVIFFDLDNLKDINDSLGHHAGDLLLLEAAARLGKAARSTDSVYRLGGDEFVVMAEGLADDDAAMELAEAIRQTLTGRTQIEDVEVFISSSVGVATAPPGVNHSAGRTNGLSLLRDADSAMYRAKRRGRARVELFTGELYERAEARLRLTGALERAIEQSELRLAYQPIISMATGTMTGVEALLRWDHPEFGHLGPATFVEVAEQSGLIGRLGTWALGCALGELVPWHEAVGLRLSVNVAPRQLSDPHFVELVTSLLARSGLPPSALTLEITERTLVEGAEMADCLARLRAHGIGISIDDFGTGYSALAYLRRFAADELKLDASFVRDLRTAHQGAAVTRAIIEMAHALGMTVTAEGVSEAEQLEVLRGLGCDRAQGFLLGEPMTPAQLAARIAASRPHGEPASAHR
jgi:diguanylate cyclase (GGDEF)-like protein/PAS domain S-box-containing protein